MIKKRSIVWYWNGKEWRKGKVVSVNKYWGPARSNTCPGLLLKERSTGKLTYARAWAYPASEPKPHLPGNDYEQWYSINKTRYRYSSLSQSKAKLFRKLNITPKDGYV